MTNTTKVVKKKLKVLVLFDGTSPTTVDQDFSDELKTKEWRTEADVMNALGTLGTHRSIWPFMTMSIFCGKNWRRSRRCPFQSSRTIQEQV
jgi:hypothetical protein